MTHGELRVKFLKYHQETYPDRRCFDNRTGWAKFIFKGVPQFVPYGIPSPKKGRLKNAGGGGPDLISFGFDFEYSAFTAVFYELKTKKDNLRPNQKRFANWITKNMGEYYIVKEDDSRRGFRLIQLSQ